MVKSHDGGGCIFFFVIFLILYGLLLSFCLFYMYTRSQLVDLVLYGLKGTSVE